MFRVTALLLVAIAMPSAAIAQDAKQDTIQVRGQPSLAQAGPLPDCNQARGRNSIPWNSDMPAPPETGLRITDPNKDPLTSHEYPAPQREVLQLSVGLGSGPLLGRAQRATTRRANAKLQFVEEHHVERD
jgi:hypothetical protein